MPNTAPSDLASMWDLARAGASGIGHDVLGGLAGAEELVRTRSADRAAEAVRRIRARSYQPGPGGQQLASALSSLPSYFNPSRLASTDIQSELSRVGGNAQQTWEHLTNASPLAGAALAAAPAAMFPEGTEAERTGARALEATPGAAALTRNDLDLADFPAMSEDWRRVRPLAGERRDYPGIYKDPRQLASEAEARVAPEDPAMGDLFGVSRSDLASIADRPGNVPGVIPGLAANPQGSAAAERITTPANTRRLVNALDAFQTHAPNLTTGMKGWYVMDPVYQRMLQLHNGDEGAAKAAYDQLNYFMGMSSPNMPVTAEITRGTAANMMANQNRWGEWMAYGGMPAADRPIPGLAGVPGKIGHSTSDAPAMDDYLNTGSNQMGSPKVPNYILASGVPQTAFQTDTPIMDAHVVRHTGLADMRGGPAKASSSITGPELYTLRPWWQDIAEQSGLQPVPAQGISWGGFGPQTGVKTALGAPKLELLSQQIMETAQRLGVSPEEARDMVLMGQTYAGGE